MNGQQSEVRQFHERYGYPVADRPSIPSEAELQLRMALLREEVAELNGACAARDLTAVADALADILYVSYGTAVVCGIDLGAVFDAVHISNMSKTPTGGPKPGKGESYAAPQILDLVAARDGPP